MRRFFLSLIPLLMLSSLAAKAQEKSTFVFVERDSALRLDVWQPAHPRPDSACVIALFGGGFVAGERDNELQTAIAHELTERGFVVVSPDYRLGLKDSAMVARYGRLTKLHNLFQYAIDLAVEDCAEAVAWVVRHDDELGIHPQRIVLTGSSAGAITVLQTDYCRANALPQAAALPAGWQPAAVVSYAGAIFCGNRALHYASAPAPTMMLHGTKDKIVAYRNMPGSFSKTLFGSPSVFKEFKRKCYPCWMVRYEGIGHEVASFLPGSVDFFCGFVNQVFNGRCTTLDATMSDTLLVPTRWSKMTLFDLYK